MNPKADLLIVTTTRVESRAVIEVFEQATGTQATPVSLSRRVYRDLGELNGTRVFMALSEMGSGGLNASLQAVEKGIDALAPDAVIMIGIAFGVDEEKQAIGDVLVSRQLRLYELQRVGRGRTVLRGDRVPASPWLTNYLRSADLDAGDYTVRFGLILTGEKLVDNLKFRDRLKQFEPEAIGGEMESAGLYVACQDRQKDWILVKGICDWGDGHKAQDKDARQALAARNAAHFVADALQHARLKGEPAAAPAQREDTSTVSLPATVPVDRRALFERLRSLPPGLLAQLIFTLEVPAGIVRGGSAPQGERVDDLLNWAQATAGRLEALTHELERVLGHP